MDWGLVRVDMGEGRWKDFNNGKNAPHEVVMGTGTWGMRDKFIYHVMIRGINRQDIFEAPEDYRKFIETLASLREVVSEDMQTKICTCHIYAYCIMPNHVIPDIEIREAVINACGLRSISDFQLLTLERRKSVIQEVMRSLDVRPRQLSRVTGMNYETIRNIAKKLP
jgi:REP element-mobilizing transposase RayT